MNHPILFTAPMVRAILDGHKTQTRRVAKLNAPGRVARGGHNWHCGDLEAVKACPYGQPGDLIWVREVWRTVAEADRLPPRDLSQSHRIWFEADAPHQPGFGKYRPSMFMPRWASRITLELTDVQLERVQEIGAVDALNEGCPLTCGINPQIWFCGLWDSINAKRGYRWDANPWVWALTFKVVKP